MSMMAIKKARYFESQEEDEEVIFVIRRHWLVLVAPILIALFVLILVFVLGWLMNSLTGEILNFDLSPYIVIIEGLTVLYVLLYSFMSWLIHYLNVVILTNKHLVEIEQVSLFNRKISTLSLDHVEDVTSQEKGLIRTLLDFGNVNIQTAGEMSNFLFMNFKDPEGIERRIMEAKSAHESRFQLPNNNFPPSQPPTSNMA